MEEASRSEQRSSSSFLFKFSREDNRRATFNHKQFHNYYNSHYPPPHHHHYDNQARQMEISKLARAGFMYVEEKDNVQCFTCNLIVDHEHYTADDVITEYHERLRPHCNFVKQLQQQRGRRRSKAFSSLDHLRYEKDRLDSFIDWPLPWLSPKEVAAAGFYYWRNLDCCACVYCRGIVGDWESNDIPMYEHLKHFPTCPFARGVIPVGNVSLEDSLILDKLPLDGEEPPYPKSSNSNGHQRVPKKLEFCTEDVRIESFSDFAPWPDRIVQKPETLAKAGFYYTGISDHVMCYHCGNGICNWEIDDDPMDLHAQFFPQCQFIKDSGHINKLKKKIKPSSGRFKSLSESDLDILINSLDVMKQATMMGYSSTIIRDVLSRRLKHKGLPYISYAEFERDFRDEVMYREIEKKYQISTRIPTQQINRGTEGGGGGGIMLVNENGESSSSSSTITTVPPPPPPLREDHILPEYEDHILGFDETGRGGEESAAAAGGGGRRRGEEEEEVEMEMESVQDEDDNLYNDDNYERIRNECVRESNEPSSSSLKEREPRNIDSSCKICMDSSLEIVFVPCTHMVSCYKCAEKCPSCPVCREPILHKIKPIIS